jgi:hypothetical protein
MNLDKEQSPESLAVEFREIDWEGIYQAGVVVIRPAIALDEGFWVVGGISRSLAGGRVVGRGDGPA